MRVLDRIDVESNTEYGLRLNAGDSSLPIICFVHDAHYTHAVNETQSLLQSSRVVFECEFLHLAGKRIMDGK